MYNYILLQLIGTVIIVAGLLFLLTRAGLWRWLGRRLKKQNKLNLVVIIMILIGLILIIAGDQKYKLHFAMPANLHSQAPDQNPPSLPVFNALDFLRKSSGMERV